jgi:uncharacterized protein (DUF849 family)
MYIFRDCDCEPVGKLVITLAPTGMIPTKKETPFVAITPEEIAADAFEAYKLGASIVHVHARDENGKPTYKKEAFERIFKEIKRKCPDIIICATTSGRVHPQVEHRAEVLDLYPEMASLTLGSLNFPQYRARAGELIDAMSALLKEDPTLNLCDDIFCFRCRELERRLNLFKRIANPLFFQKSMFMRRLLSSRNQLVFRRYSYVSFKTLKWKKRLNSHVFLEIRLRRIAWIIYKILNRQ